MYFVNFDSVNDIESNINDIEVLSLFTALFR